MSLVEIENNTLADADVLNSNFLYLENRITTIANAINSHDSSYESNLLNLSSAVNSLQTNLSTLTTSVNNINGTSFMTVTFDTANGTWVKEYFSDKTKSTRIFLEQGGRYNTESSQSADVDNYKLKLPKRFSDTNYYFTRTVHFVANQDIGARFLNTYNDKTVEYDGGIQYDMVTLDVVRYAYSHGFDWYACGK